MIGELVAVGTELLRFGGRDTNTPWLTERLNALGIEIAVRAVVEDDVERIASIVRAAIDRGVELVVVTGGLGPTDDDRTREGLAQALGARLIVDPVSEQLLRRRCAERGFRFDERQARQTRIPEGAAAIRNPLGSACGFAARHGAAVVAALPGVPGEMRAMLDDVLARLSDGGARTLVRRAFHVAGIGEPELDARVVPLDRRGGVELTVLSKDGALELHARVGATTPGEAEERLERLTREVEGVLGDDLVGIDDETLPVVVGRSLASRGRTLAVAESCTGGLLGAALTSVPGSSGWFRGGVLVYDDEMKRMLCGVGAATLASCGAVSRETAVAMARGVRERCGADLGVGVTGIAGPSGATPGKPVGLVYLALAAGAGAEPFELRTGGDRETVRLRAVAAALDRVRRSLIAG